MTGFPSSPRCVPQRVSSSPATGAGEDEGTGGDLSAWRIVLWLAAEEGAPAKLG